MSYDTTLAQHPGVFLVVDGRGEVRINPFKMDAGRPIVLHELLHAFHFFELGISNPDVINAFQITSRAHAQRGASTPPYFLTNPKEFFAVTATIHLVGEIRQPPFTCQPLQRNPAYLAFLRTWLGPGKC